MATVFDCIKKAVLRADGTVITEAYSSTDQVAVEAADLANEVASDIASTHDWRAITKVASLTGTGAQVFFPFPADYDRMTQGSWMADKNNWAWGYTPYRSVDEWMTYVNGGYALGPPGGWIILGGGFQFYPAPAASSIAQFPYISTEWALSESGTPKSEFTMDNDTFVLDDRLLTLGILWRWKAQKGLDYSEDMANYELALGREQLSDKGSRMINGSRRIPPDMSIAYPWQLGPGAY